MGKGNIDFVGGVEKAKELKRQLCRSHMSLACHAEESALNNYRSKYRPGSKNIATRKLKIIVIRINKDGNMTESKPCSHCISVMKSFGIRKVTYSNKEGKLVTESVDDVKTTESTGYQSIAQVIEYLDSIIKTSPT